MNKEIMNNIITVLIRIHNEAKTPDTPEQFGRCSLGIRSLLENVERDFGEKMMMKIFYLTSKELGTTLGPLDASILKKLIKNGLKITAIKKCCVYKKNIKNLDTII